jgi:hypothetical protein
MTAPGQLPQSFLLTQTNTMKKFYYNHVLCPIHDVLVIVDGKFQIWADRMMEFIDRHPRLLKVLLWMGERIDRFETRLQKIIGN